MTVTTTYLSIAAASVVSASIGQTTQHLCGIGLFIAERGQGGRWRFSQRSHSIAAGESEDLLLIWVTERLPVDATLIGWNVDHTLSPALLDAASSASPAIACRFIGRLAELMRGGVVDLALGRGGAARPMSEIAADLAIYAPTCPGDELTAAWALGHTGQLSRDLAAEALAIWRMFIRAAAETGTGAEAATDAWVESRQRLRPVGEVPVDPD